jgi:hypothetical protein
VVPPTTIKSYVFASDMVVDGDVYGVTDWCIQMKLNIYIYVYQAARDYWTQHFRQADYESFMHRPQHT